MARAFYTLVRKLGESRMKRSTRSEGSAQSSLLSVHLAWRSLMLLALCALMVVGGCKRDAARSAA